MEILTYPNTILRKKAKPITEINSEIRRKVEEMMELMYDARGIGLAAPQVGWSVRLFIIDTDDNKDDEKVFINPSIIEEDGEASNEEGCLCFPGIMGKVIRARKIKARAYNLKGDELEIEAEGLLARAFQHEMDHLNGSLFIDKMSPTARLAISNQLKELERNYEKNKINV